jgi:hypothetical protein
LIENALYDGDLASDTVEHLVLTPPGHAQPGSRGSYFAYNVLGVDDEDTRRRDRDVIDVRPPAWHPEIVDRYDALRAESVEHLANGALTRGA